jgi:Protein of unknown function (DUF3618)
VTASSAQPLPSSRLPMPRNPSTQTPAEIEADIVATRNRLAGTLDLIADRVSPKNVAERQKQKVRARVAEVRGQALAGVQQARARALAGAGQARAQALAASGQLRTQLVDAEGKPRPDRLAALGVVLVAGAALVVWRARR